MLKLEPNRYYHIYNRGNNREKLFYTEANYEYFFFKFQQHCFHVLETYAYCLMGNHFHFLVSIRPVNEQRTLFLERNLKTRKLRSPSKHLANFFSSYTQSINKQEGRVGSLFQKNFKRKEIDSEDYFRQTIVYIHLNPIKHGFSDSFETYPYSYYPFYLNSEETFLNRKKSLELFGGIENFSVAHENGVALL